MENPDSGVSKEAATLSKRETILDVKMWRQRSTGNTKNLVSAMTNKSDLLRHDPINVMYCDLSRYLYRNGRKHGEMFCLRPLQTVWQSIKLLSPRTIPPRASLSA